MSARRIVSCFRPARRLRHPAVWLAGVLAAVAPAGRAAIERFYFGNDLSYVNQMEDCGAVYRENGVAKDPFEILRDHGTNLVRVRLWHDPWWQPLIPQTAPNAKPQYSDLSDVIETITRAKAFGMPVMLDLHLSDFWADPDRQVVPRAWAPLLGNDAALETAVHDYVRDVLAELEGRGLMPEIVKIGNEANPGILADPTLTATWNSATQRLDLAVVGARRTDGAYFGRLWNAAIRAVRETGSTSTIRPRVALHVAGPNRVVGFCDWMQQIGVTDFDILGFSYYYAWHSGSIADMGAVIRAQRAKYPQYDVMLVETGYPWDQANIDGLVNIINTPDPAYTPVSPANQRRYMVDLTQEVIDAGGIGVVFWEPCWVSTPCRTPWGVGSSHEHVAYFDHRDGNNFHVGGTWMEAAYAGLPPGPAITVQPVAMRALAGGDAFFAVTASGDHLAYQWLKDGAPIAGATGPSLFLAGVGAGQAGGYAVEVSNGFGRVTSAPAVLTVASSGAARLVNLSARAQIGTGDGWLIPGFVVAGAGSRPLLIRAVGPGLVRFGVGGVLADPQMQVVPQGGGAVVAANDNWIDFSDQPGLEAARTAVSAFSLGTSTLDAALLVTLSAGGFTAPTSGVAEGTGVALVELYDLGPADATAGLVNISARAQVGAGDDILIPGFVIEGDVALTVLVRGVGPGLGRWISSGLLADPVMTLHRSLPGGGSERVTTNDDWGDAPNPAALAQAFEAVHAFALPAGSTDAAMLVALNPGAYTVAIAGADGGTGLALMELYRVSP
ncbi:MAG: glycosyl hydrolase 53 family protein [Opitutaceae bacterium]|nr:glycosyl hydrolase 53 family protein [Opitutaceae bacterium]